MSETEQSKNSGAGTPKPDAKKLKGRPRTAPRNPRGRPAGVQPADVYVGRRIRMRRVILGMSQDDLASLLNLTFQQVQKYEKGQNKISASRLYDIAQALEVDVSYFFSDFQKDDAAVPGLKALTELDAQHLNTARREVLELVRAFNRIEFEGVRKKILELTKSVAESDNNNEDDSSEDQD